MSPAPWSGRLRAGVLLARPGAPARRSVDVVVTDDVVASVGPVSTASPALGGAGALVAPALADAHDHGRGLPTLAFGAADQALEAWLPALARQPHVPTELLATYALAKLARSGVASVVHCHNTQRDDELVDECVAAATAARTVGLRMGLAVPLADRNRLGYGPDDQILACVDPDHRAAVADGWLRPGRTPAEQVGRVREVASAVRDSAPDDRLVQVQYCPVGPQWCSDALLEAVARASAEDDARVHVHLYETRYQREWADATYPGGLLRHLDAIGFLTDRLTVAHGVWLDDADLDLLAERRVVVSVNTSSNLRLRSGTAALVRMLRSGVRVAFGMDGMSVDDDEDALRELQLAHLLHAGVGLDVALRAAEVLAASVTNGPVAAAGEGPWGTVAPGAPADLVVVDRDALVADVACEDELDDAALLLARARARHVTDLVVAGRHVVGGGRVLGVDEPAVAQEIARRCRAAADHVVALRPVVTALQAGLGRFYGAGGHRTGALSPARSDA